LHLEHHRPVGVRDARGPRDESEGGEGVLPLRGVAADNLHGWCGAGLRGAETFRWGGKACKATAGFSGPPERPFTAPGAPLPPGPLPAEQSARPHQFFFLTRVKTPTVLTPREHVLNTRQSPLTRTKTGDRCNRFLHET